MNLARCVAGGLAAATSVICLAVPARADDFAPFTRFTFGMAVGTMDVGPVDGSTMGLHLEAARVMGRAQLVGEYQLFDLTDGGTYYAESSSEGLLQRVGVAVRYSPLRHQLSSRMLTGFYLEAGMGREWVGWQKGGRLKRDDLAFGIGWDLIGNLGRREKPKLLGFSYMFRATVSESPLVAETPGAAQLVCGGPCDQATAPPKYDVGLLFIMGVSLGK